MPAFLSVGHLMELSQEPKASCFLTHLLLHAYSQLTLAKRLRVGRGRLLTVFIVTAHTS